jgi:hypothetical protein
MVGQDEGGGDHGENVPCLRLTPQRAGVREEGVGFLECFNTILASRAWTYQSCPDCLASTETNSEAELYDAFRRCKIPEGGTAYAASCPFFYYWLVYRLTADRHHGSQMVDD